MLAAVGVLAASDKGCGGSSGPDEPQYHTLQSGIYEYTPDTYEPNTCWTEDQNFPPILPFQFKITHEDGVITLQAEGLAAGLFPDVVGTLDGNDIKTDAGQFELDGREAEEADVDYTGAPGEGNCIVVFSATATGELTDDNAFDATIIVEVSEQIEGGCEELYGDQLDMGMPVPFPDIGGKSCKISPQGGAILLDTL
jgi:hypothetical protein